MDPKDIGEILGFGEERAAPKLITVSVPGLPVGVPLLVSRRDDGSISAIGLDSEADPYRANPVRRTGTATLHNLSAFIAHVERFKEGRSAVFCDLTKPSLTAVYDYHDIVNTEANSTAPIEALPRFLKHRAVYNFPLSKEWLAWKKQDGQPMNQGEFAYFLEDRVADVGDPSNPSPSLTALATLLGGTFASPAELMTLAKGLKVTATENVTNAQNLSSGEGQITYDVAHSTANASGQVRVPNLFVINIPVFEMGIVYQLGVRLRYRLKEGKLSWFYNLFRSERAIDDAITEACSMVVGATSLPLFAGTPEA